MTNEKYTTKMSLRTQHENLGDLIINKATVDFLGQRRRFSFDRKKVPQWYLNLISEKLPSVLDERYTPSTEKKMLILKPGGYQGINNLKTAFRRLLHAAFLFVHRKLGYKIVRMPSSQSVSSNYALIEKIRNKQIDIILVRDNKSKKVLENEGLHAKYCPDMALYYYNTDSIFSVEQNENKKRNKEIAFSLRFDRGIKKETISLILKYFNDGSKYSFGFVTQVDHDLVINESMAEAFGCRNTKYLHSEKSIVGIRDYYSRCKYVISNRLHSLLIGALNGAIPVPIIKEGKDDKIKEYFLGIGIHNFVNIGLRGEVLKINLESDQGSCKEVLMKEKEKLIETLRSIFDV